MAGCLSRVAFAVTVVLAAPTSGALAQVAPVKTQDSAGSPATSSTTTEVIVTAQRRRENLERTPVSISALSSQTLQRDAVVSESDLQLEVPGLTVKASQGNNQLNYSLRGQTVDAFSFSRPGVLPYFNEVQIGGSGSSAFYDLQSVQVLKGPQGTLFGRNSTGGAVLFTTTQPSNTLGGYVTLRGGDYNDAQAEGALNIPIVTDKVLLRIAGFVQSRDGFQYNLYDNARLGSIRRKNVRASLLLKPINHLTNTLVVDFANSGGTNETGVIYNILPVGVGSPFVPNNLLYSPAIDSVYGPGTFARFLAAHPGAYPGGIGAFAALQHERGPFLVDVDAPEFHRANNLITSNITTYDLTSDNQIKNIVGYTHLVGDDGGEFDGTPFPADSNGTEGRGGSLRQFSEELQDLGKILDHRLSYVVGLYYSDENDVERSSSVIADLEPLAPATNQINYGQITNRTYAAYGQGTLDLSRLTGLNGLGFTAGVRYASERVSLRHLPGDVYVEDPIPEYLSIQSDVFKKLSWQLGLQEQLNPDLLLYVASRHGNRSGGFNFFAPPLAGFGNDGGSEYKPETATDVEVGAKYQGHLLSLPVRANVAIYNMWVDDIQRSNYVEIFGELAGITVNVPKAEIGGLETDAAINLTRWLSLGGSLNYTDARFTSNLVSVLGNPAAAFGPYPDTPRWSGSLFAEAQVPLTDRLQGSVRSELYGESSSYFSSTANTLNPGSQIPGYMTANFSVSIQDRAAGWTLSGLVKNAFDHTYFVGGVGFTSLLALNTVVPGDPRTFLVEASYKF